MRDTCLEELTQGLYERELEVLGQAAHVVVGLDHVAVLLPVPGGGQDSMTSGYSVPCARMHIRDDLACDAFQEPKSVSDRVPSAHARATCHLLRVPALSPHCGFAGCADSVQR